MRNLFRESGTPHKLWRKIRSGRGASLGIALLVFIVCAALGSVIFTAGTGAVGRASGLTESEQRYYSVSSAASLLQKLVESKEISVVFEKETTEETNFIRVEDPVTHVINTTYDATPTPGGGAAYRVFLNGEEITDTFGSKREFLEALALKQLMGASYTTAEKSVLWSDFGLKEREISNLQMVMEFDGPDEKAKEKLKVDLTVEVDSDNLVLTVAKNWAKIGKEYGAATDSQKEVYALKMTFTLTAQNKDAYTELVSESEKETGHDDDGNVKGTRTQTIVERQEAKLRWRLTEISKVS